MSQRNLVDPKTKVEVSGTAPGTSRKAILTSSEEAWTSPSLPAYIHLTFPTPISGATHFALTFQGGFVATTVGVWVAGKHKSKESIDLGLAFGGRVYPEDKSRRQVFRLPFPSILMSAYNPRTDPSVTEVDVHPDGAVTPLTEQQTAPAVQNASAHTGDVIYDEDGNAVPDITELKIELEASSDNQGRVTLYQVEVLG